MFQDARSTGAGRAFLTVFPGRPRAAALRWGTRLAALGMAWGLVLAVNAERTLEAGASATVADATGVSTPAAGVCSSAAASSSLGCAAASDASLSGERVTPAWVRPVSVDGAAVASNLVPAVLTVPPGWRAGDAAAVVMAEQPWAERWRTRLTNELLADGVAVLELDVHTARGVAADSAAAPPPLAPQDLLPDLFGALQLLAGEEFGAASIIALGRGAGGTAALLAARDGAATRHLGTHGPRFAATARLGSGCEWTAIAAEPPAGWRAEALHFGTMLAAGGPWTSEPAQSGAAEAASLACAAALILPASGRPRQSP
jgi:hypothetical protein